MTHQDLDFDGVENSANPRANADNAEHAGEPEGDDGAKKQVSDEVRRRAPALNRQVRITEKDLDKFGYEPDEAVDRYLDIMIITKQIPVDVQSQHFK